MSPAAEAGWRDCFVQVDDGALIYYRWLGEEGPVVVLCDGIGCQGFAWRHIAPALVARGHRVIHFHNRGHGRTPPPPDPERVSIEVLADDAAQVLTHAGAEHAVFAGHSMGVQTCLEAYRRHPHRIQGLVLTCGSYGSPLRTLYGSDLAHHLMPLLRLVVRRGRWPLRLLWRSLIPTDLAFRVAVRLEVNGELIPRRDMTEYLAHLAHVEPELFLRMLAAADAHSAGDLLEQITVPVLLVDGEWDGFTPLALSREMARRIPGAELIVVPEGTHAAPLERPDLVTPAVVGFIARATGNQAPAAVSQSFCQTPSDPNRL